MIRKILAISAIFLALADSSARAKEILNLTPAPLTTITRTSASGDVFIVQNNEVQPTGSGVIDPFSTIQQNGQERGFNTDTTSPNLLDNKRAGNPSKTDGFTRSLQLGNIDTVLIGPAGSEVEYIAFLLDVNQRENPNNFGFLSLNQVQIFVSDSKLGDSFVASTDLVEANSTRDAIISFASATEVFRLNNQQNNSIDLTANYEIQIDSNHGSGSGDMFLYVRRDQFGTNPFAYVTLFSQFGNPSGTYASSAGFEEWAVRSSNPSTAVVPEPSTVVTALVGLIPFGMVGLRRRFLRTRQVSA